MDDYPKISVVVPIRNEEKHISQTIGMIQDQEYPSGKLEILVVDGESNDQSRRIVKSLSDNDDRIKLYPNPKRLSSAARNIGMNNSTGDIITFIDGHTYIDNNMLFRNIADLMKTEEVSVLSRPQFLDVPENSFFQKVIALARKSLIGHGLDSTIYCRENKRVDPTSSGATYTRKVVDKVGNFDENFDACEDVDFNYRVFQAGYESFTSLKLAVYYHPRNSFKGLFQQIKRYGIGRLRLVRKYPGMLTLGTLVPPAITFGIPLLGLISIFSNFFLYLFGLSVGLYLGLIIIWSLGLSLKNDIRYFFFLPFVYLTIHIGLGWGFGSELLKALMQKRPSK
ncbi:MAG: glycosyltransferase [candidate division Zixibacteria bacterium]|nr:glycosyltransferase [candidate division Zixibacteria bacterium]